MNHPIILHLDYPDWRAGFENKIYEEKKALLDQYGIAVWRDHDHTHAHNPDGIFTGVIKYLGWEQYRVNADTEGMTMYFEFPDMTVEKMNALLKEKMCLNGIRYIGNPKDKLKKVAMVGHLLPNIFEHQPTTGDGFCKEYATEVIRIMEEEDVDAIIPGETIDWTVMSYIQRCSTARKSESSIQCRTFQSGGAGEVCRGLDSGSDRECGAGALCAEWRYL